MQVKPSDGFVTYIPECTKRSSIAESVKRAARETKYLDAGKLPNNYPGKHLHCILPDYVNWVIRVACQSQTNTPGPALTPFCKKKA